MSNATRGTVLAGRYRLEDRYHANTDASVWRAADLTLDRPVTVRVMRPGHPYAADVADAARRAALIDDPRLVRVLDVGTDGDLTFVVSSHVDGDSLATLIERAPLAPPVVRRIVGEVAQGLRGAAARGLHHLRLTPRSVIICYDNTIKISGVAVEAASAGLDPVKASEATRVDALSLIGLLYAGLTGRWPLGDPGFAPAPRANGGGPIAPAELVPDIPGDLNRLCMLTLGPLDSGPHSPAEVVGMLSPWPTAEEAPLRSATRPRDPATPATPNPALVMRGRSSGHTPGTGLPSRPATPPAPTPAPAPDPALADPDRTVAASSAWPPASGGENLFDPRRRDREVGKPDPDATLPPSAAGNLFAPLRRDPAPQRAEAAEAPRQPRPTAWQHGAGAAQRAAAPEDVTRPAQRPVVQPAQPTKPARSAESAEPAEPSKPAEPAWPTPTERPAPSRPQQRRTASLFPTPSVAITGSMPLPPRVKGGGRTDALFGGDPQAEQPAAAQPSQAQQQAQQPSRQQGQQPQQARPQQSQRPPAAPLEAAPPLRSRGQSGPAGPLFGQAAQAPAAGRASQAGSQLPLRPQRPMSNPAAGGRPVQARAPQNRPEEASRPGPDGNAVRRTASIFPTPSVAMTGSMPLPPRPKSRGRTEALFGDIDPAIDTQITPAPLRGREQAERAAQARQFGGSDQSGQQGHQGQQGQPSQPGQPAARQSRSQPAQFAQPPRTQQPTANPLDSGPIATAAAARTAAGMRAGRPTSRPIAGVQGSQGFSGGYPGDPGFQGDPTVHNFQGGAGNQGFAGSLGSQNAQGDPGFQSPQRQNQRGHNQQGSNPMARPIIPDPGPALAPSSGPGAPPSLFSSPSRPGYDAPDAEVAPLDQAGQHAAMGSERAAGPGRHRGPAAGRGPAAENSRLPWSDGWSSTPPSPLESSGPFPIVIPPDAPPKDQSRKVLFGVLVVFLVLLVVAAWSLRGLFTGSDAEPVATRERGPVITTAPIAEVSEQPAETATAEPSATPTETAVPVRIKTVTAIDPQGDGEEDSGAAPLAVDGDKDTVWESDRYQSEAFGGLKKGLGLAIELRRSAAVSSAQIDVAGTGGRVQVRSADEPDFESSTAVGSGSFENGTVTVEADDEVEPAKYVILWFTELPKVESGYRMEVSEVRLT